RHCILHQHALTKIYSPCQPQSEQKAAGSCSCVLPMEQTIHPSWQHFHGHAVEGNPPILAHHEDAPLGQKQLGNGKQKHTSAAHGQQIVGVLFHHAHLGAGHKAGNQHHQNANCHNQRQNSRLFAFSSACHIPQHQKPQQTTCCHQAAQNQLIEHNG